MPSGTIVLTWPMIPMANCLDNNSRYDRNVTVNDACVHSYVWV